MFNFKKKRNRGFEPVIRTMKKNQQGAIMPLRGSANAIAYDIYSPIDITIQPLTSEMIWTDIKAYFNDNEALIINVRSSMGKHPVMLSNTQGWIESDYYDNEDNNGNIGIKLYNLNTTEPYVIKRGDRIAQAMFIPFLVSDNCNSSQIRKGGFGSTGK